MISRLVRTEIESHIHDLVLWGGAALALLLLFVAAMGQFVARTPEPGQGDMIGTFVLSLFVTSLFLGVRVFRRQVREKRIRLYSQLPVSTLEIFAASWCFRLLCVLIPASAWMGFIALTRDLSFSSFALKAIVFYLTITTLMAAISVAMSISDLPSGMAFCVRWVYTLAGIAVLTVWLMWGFVMGRPGLTERIFQALGVPAGWLPLVLSLVVSSAGLIVADIWLRSRADNYLG
jgi:hypothetical protein